jgi:hypothetical protein
MVSIWLMKIKGAGECSKTKKTGFAEPSRFSENATHSSCAGVTRASIDLRKVFQGMDCRVEARQ